MANRTMTLFFYFVFHLRFACKITRRYNDDRFIANFIVCPRAQNTLLTPLFTASYNLGDQHNAVKTSQD